MSAPRTDGDAGWPRRGEALRAETRRGVRVAVPVTGRWSTPPLVRSPPGSRGWCSRARTSGAGVVRELARPPRCCSVDARPGPAAATAARGERVRQPPTPPAEPSRRRPPRTAGAGPGRPAARAVAGHMAHQQDQQVAQRLGVHAVAAADTLTAQVPSHADEQGAQQRPAAPRPSPPRRHRSARCTARRLRIRVVHIGPSPAGPVAVDPCQGELLRGEDGQLQQVAVVVDDLQAVLRSRGRTAARRRPGAARTGPAASARRRRGRPRRRSRGRRTRPAR